MLQKYKDKRQSGFTIIEVVIVLAIAGLIFAIVFIAVPQLQASQRDNTRRAEAGRLSAGISSYIGNNAGKTPVLADVTGKVVGTGKYVENFDYGVTAAASNTASPETMAYVKGNECKLQSGTTQALVLQAGSSRGYAIVVHLESGAAAGTYYCVNG